MKNFFAILFLSSLVSQSLQANPVYAPDGSTWVKIESVETTDSQVNIEGYVQGSTVLHLGYASGFEATKSHCLRSFYLMMEKPGKYETKVNNGYCTLKVVK
jgi:hypothetical protein